MNLLPFLNDSVIHSVDIAYAYELLTEKPENYSAEINILDNVFYKVEKQQLKTTYIQCKNKQLKEHTCANQFGLSGYAKYPKTKNGSTGIARYPRQTFRIW